MKTVAKLFRSSIRTAEFQNNVGTDTVRARRLKEFLKDETYSVYVMQNKETWEGYLVATYRHGDPTLTCHYFEEFVPGAFDKVGLALVLDHTGFEYMSCPAPTDDVEQKLVEKGFVLSDIVWACHSKLFDKVITASEIKIISGDAYAELTKDDKDVILNLVSGAICEELGYDIRGYYTHIGPLAETVIARIQHANVETAIWRDGRTIVGIAQMRLVTPGVVELSGLTVAPTHRKRGIGRRLMGALFDFAQRHSDQVYIETAADNNPANHLYGNILRCRQVLRTLTLKRDPELVSWKRVKGNRADRVLKEEPSIPVETKPRPAISDMFQSGMRGC